jgi:hypothetical protein
LRFTRREEWWDLAIVKSSTPRTRQLLKILASRPPDMHDEELHKLINEELRALTIDEITYIRDRVRWSCPPSPLVQSVVLMVNGLIELKSLRL